VSGGAASPVGGKWQSDLTAGHAAALLKMRHRLFLPRSLPQLVFLVSAKQCFTENKRPTFLYILVGQERERERETIQNFLPHYHKRRVPQLHYTHSHSRNTLLTLPQMYLYTFIRARPLLFLYHSAPFVFT
jgi:hypothetical protein